jgi:hypothetical protein
MFCVLVVVFRGDNVAAPDLFLSQREISLVASLRASKTVRFGAVGIRRPSNWTGSGRWTRIGVARCLSAILHVCILGITMTPRGSQGTRRERSGNTPSGRDVGWSRGFCPYRPSVRALAPPSFATTPKTNVLIRDPGNSAAGLNLGSCGVDDTVPRRTVRPAANPSPAEAPVLFIVQASCVLSLER